MKAKKFRKILSFALTLVMLVSMFSMCLVSVSASDADILLDNEANSFANWSNSLAADGTLNDGMVRKVLTVNDGVWPEDKSVKQVSMDFTATTTSGAYDNSVSFIYYYEDENNYKMFCARETQAGALYVSLTDKVNGENQKPEYISSNRNIMATNTNLATKSTDVSLGMKNGANITITYVDSDNIDIRIASADDSAEYTLTITDLATDEKDLDFKSAANQKFAFVVNALNSGFQYKTDAIKVEFDKDLTITGSSVTDNAANEFEHFSTYIAADGAVKVQGTAFSMNDGVWPQGKQLKSVEMNLTVKMNGDGNAYMRLIYDYKDAQNYKTLTVRESGSNTSATHYLYHGLVDIVGGKDTKPTDVTATNGVITATSAGINSNKQVGFLTGTNVKIEYLDSSNVKFTFTNNTTAESFTTTVTADSGSNLDFKGVSEQFYIMFTSATSNIKFTDITVEWEKGAEDDIAAFKSKYASVLVDTKDATLLATVNAAIAEYQSLPQEVKDGLVNEYAQLKKNYNAIIVENGTYSTNFENGVDGWEQFADFKDKNNNTVIQNDIKVEALDSDRIGGISQNESGNIFVADTTVTADTYANAANANDNTWAINATMMISPSRDIWATAKSEGKNFASAEFDLYANISGSSSGVFVYYNYVDNNNFSYFRLTRVSGGLGVYNMVVGEDEATGLRTRAYNGITNSYPLANWANNANNWVHISIAYNNSGKAVISVKGIETDETYSLTSYDVVPVENRMFAIGSAPHGSTKVKAVIDNFSMVLANAETQEGIYFELKYAETLALNTELFAAYDAIEVDAMMAAYADLSQVTKDSLKQTTRSAISALNDVRALWDTTSDETVAASYKAIWGAKLETETEKAWNVYNRLTAAQKALLSDEYDVLVAAMNGKTQVTDDKVNINCVGDSITFGSGSTSVADYSYPSQMQSMLGDGYNVSRNGIAGIRVVEDYTVTSVADVKLGMAGSQQWIDSHKGTEDIIIIQLGTNDLSHVEGADEIKTELYKAGLEKMIQSYLRLENSPLVVISNTPVSYSAADRGYAYKTIALINMAMAEKYGLPCIDMQAYTEAYTDEEIATYYSADRLHFTNEGYTKMAQVFADAVKSLSATFDTADVTAYTFEENTLNSFLAPEMVSATIKKSNKAATQDLGFRTKVSKIVKTGTTIVEYGTIFSKYAAANEDAILSRMVYRETADENNLVLYARGNGANAAGIEYIAGLGCAQGTETKEAYIARAYVKYSDGSVYYSVNDYKNATSYSERKGVINGYACRSVVSIAKEMVKFLAVNGIADDTIASYDASTDALTFTETAKANYDLIFGFLTAHKDDISRLVAGGN